MAQLHRPFGGNGYDVIYLPDNTLLATFSYESAAREWMRVATRSDQCEIRPATPAPAVQVVTVEPNPGVWVAFNPLNRPQVLRGARLDVEAYVRYRNWTLDSWAPFRYPIDVPAGYAKRGELEARVDKLQAELDAAQAELRALQAGDK